MKFLSKKFIHSFLIVVVFTVMFVASIFQAMPVYAEAPGATDPATLNALVENARAQEAATPNGTQNIRNVNAALAADPTSPQNSTQGSGSNATKAPANGAGCFTDVGCWVTRGFAWIAWVIFYIAGQILFLAGMLLDQSIKLSIITVFSQSGEFALSLTGAINIGWGVLRDIANMFFIFILLYTGIMLILGQEDHPGTRIKNVIIIAFLVNFSLLFTKLAIDASNMVSLVFYKILVPNDSMSLSGLFMNGLGLNNGLLTSAAVGGKDYYYLAIISYLLGTVVAVITAWVFLSAAITFIVRTIGLLILMILSPLAFVMYAFPGSYNKHWGEWLKHLIQYCTVAPIYLFLIWVCAYIISAMLRLLNPLDGSRAATLGEGIAAGAGGTVSAASGINYYLVFFVYAIVIGLIWASLKIAKDLSKSVPGSGLGKTLIGGAAGLALGGVGGFLGRQVLGRGAAALAGNEGFKNYAAKSRTGKLLYNTTSKAASGTYDVRNSKIATKTGEQIGANFGKGTTGSYQKRIDDKAVEKAKFVETLGVDKKKLGAQDKIIKEQTDEKENLDRNIREKQKVVADTTRAAAGRPLTVDEQQTIDAYNEGIRRDTALKTGAEGAITRAKTVKGEVSRARPTAYAQALTSRSLVRWVVTKSSKKASDRIGKDVKIDGLEDRIKEKTDELNEHKAEIKRLTQIQKAGTRPLTPAEVTDLNTATDKKYAAEQQIRQFKFDLAINKK